MTKTVIIKCYIKEKTGVEAMIFFLAFLGVIIGFFEVIVKK